MSTIDTVDINLYKRMFLIRIVEQNLLDLFSKGLFVQALFILV